MDQTNLSPIKLDHIGLGLSSDIVVESPKSNLNKIHNLSKVHNIR